MMKILRLKPFKCMQPQKQYNEFIVALEDLKLPESTFLTELLDDSMAEHIQEEFAEVLNKVKGIIQPRAGYAVFHPGEFSIHDSYILCGLEKFNSKKIVTRALERSDYLYVFVVSIGGEAEKLVKKLMAAGEYLHGYFADIIASAYTESCAAWVEKIISDRAAVAGEECTMRYSPGYCGWDVEEQKKLFSLLPDGFCGVQLSKSALMIPLKSISGILGTGKSVVREEYQCGICEMNDCLRYKV
ncbi:MAG: hypothetical protein HYV28_01225 [Ignavibacteriales bacterium]|nr:hypothetical protein [Ignavibacteriales bacterium]